MLLDDGTVIGSIANTCTEKPAGFTAQLPATCAPDVVDQHLEHFAVESRTWIRTAATERTSPGATKPKP